VIELGLYDSSVKLFRQLADRGVKPLSKEWNDAVERHWSGSGSHASAALSQDSRQPLLVLYPMDRKRGEQKNWYMLPIEERQRQMEEHGMVGRRYAGKVQQIITAPSASMIGSGAWTCCSRSAGIQETDLRNALRRSQRGVCGFRPVLPGSAASGAKVGGMAERRVAKIAWLLTFLK